MSEINKAVERLTSLSEGNKSWAKHTATPQQAFDLREDAKAIDALLAELSRLREEVATLRRERDEAREICREVAALQSEDGGRSFPSKELCDRAAALRPSEQGGRVVIYRVPTREEYEPDVKAASNAFRRDLRSILKC